MKTNLLLLLFISTCFNVSAQQKGVANNNFRLHRQTIQDWNGGNWENYERYTYSYFFLDRINIVVKEIYDNTGIVNPDFYVQSRKVYSYDSIGRITEIVQQTFNDPDWTNSLHFVYSFDT